MRLTSLLSSWLWCTLAHAQVMAPIAPIFSAPTGITYGTISIRGSNGFSTGQSNYSATGTVTANYTAAPTNSGDLLVCNVESSYASATTVTVDTSTMTDAGSAWSLAVEKHDANIGHTQQIWWRKVGSVANSATLVTATGGVNVDHIVIECAEYATTSGTFQLDGTPTTASASNYPASTATPDAGAITVNGSSSLIVVMTSDSGTAITAGTGYTRRVKNSSGPTDASSFDPTAMFAAGSTPTAQVSGASQTWIITAGSFSAH